MNTDSKNYSKLSHSSASTLCERVNMFRMGAFRDVKVVVMQIFQKEDDKAL